MLWYGHNFLEKAKDLADTAKEYRDASIEIEDPRAEAADIFDELKNSLLNVWGKDMADQIKMNASQYNSMLLARR